MDQQPIQFCSTWVFPTVDYTSEPFPKSKNLIEAFVELTPKVEVKTRI